MNDAERVHAPSRRGNGLQADDYVRVARPTSALADTALDALRRTGIAARLTGSEVEGREELWADAHELDDVATVLSAVVRHAGVEPDDLGRVGEEAVLAELGDTLTAEDLDDLSDDHPGPNGTRNPTPSARPYPTPSRPRASRPRDTGPVDPPRSHHVDDLDDVDDPEDHFRPEEPESLRALSRTTVWALAILALGVVALALSGLAPTIVGVYAPLASLLGTAAVLVGVGMLVTRLRDGRRDDGDDAGGPNGDGAIL
ncbi:hypothetical protein ACXR2U_20270 [Jatrophihabitans sp. YIM 134969]